jgi:hypothetical protein
MTQKMSSQLRDALRSHALESIYWPHPAKVIVEKDLPSFYRAAAEQVGHDEPILYLEFGVAHGKSISEIAKIYQHADARFFGFDSFLGLPEDWLMHKKGAFANQGRPPVIDDKRVRFVQGWFQNTVPATIQRLSRLAHRRILVHFDADLYSSTLFLLSLFWSNFDEYYFIFDDFIHDEVVALADFMQAFPNRVEFFIQTRGGGSNPNPDQVFGKITREEFRLE